MHFFCYAIQAKHADMASELQRRQESYMRREDHLRAQLAAAVAGAPGGGVAWLGAPLPSSSAGAGAAAAVTAALAAPSHDAASGSGGNTSGGGGGLAAMQAEVISGVEELLDRQRVALAAGEAAALRGARARLAEATAALAAERAARQREAGDGGASLVGGGGGRLVVLWTCVRRICSSCIWCQRLFAASPTQLCCKYFL